MKFQRPRKRNGVGAAVLLLLAFLLVCSTLLLWSQPPVNDHAARLQKKKTTQPLVMFPQQHHYEKDGSHQISRTNKLAYIHIPKTGGSTVEESSLFDDHRQATGRKAAGHYRVSQFQELTDDTFVTATTVRHPVDRFVSAFYYSKQGPPSHAKHPHHKIVQRLMGDVYTVADFVHKLDTTPGLWNQAKRAYIHMIPMVYWTVVHDAFGIDVVMCQEEWLEGVQRLLQAMNATTVPTGIVQYKRLNQHQEELDESTQQSILREYAMDTCLFGYDAKYNPPTDKCIGSVVTTKDEFTKRYQWCKEQI